jgi:hypothetical protein
MQRVTPAGIRRAASFALLGLAACESSAPAAPEPMAAAARPTPAASDWTGLRAPPAAAPFTPLDPDDAFKHAWVLHVGDSFVNASFQQNLGPRVRATGSNYVVEAETATYTTTWASDPDFEKWLDRRPALVLVTLGANEVDMPVPLDHARAVETIAHKVSAAGAACVWITPPLWKNDSGFLQVIHDHCAPCLFFDTDAVLGGLEPDERQRDGIHPNELGGQRWADAFWGWLQEHREPARGPWALAPFERRGS